MGGSAPNLVRTRRQVSMAEKYVMTISRMTIDKLGVKLYDKVAAVLAEIVANSYDADATQVVIKVPMGEFLATSRDGSVEDRGFVIEVKDNGSGMVPKDINEFYLKVGAERRKDPRRGDQSKIFRRKVMGRKGIGKLAPFGICSRVELVSSGGEPIPKENPGGRPSDGYLTAHLVLEGDKILSDTDERYLPAVGDLDGKLSSSRGTLVRLSGFHHRRVPPIDDLEKQLAQRFGIRAPNWEIVLEDTAHKEEGRPVVRTVGEFKIETMANTMMRFAAEVVDDNVEYRVYGPDGTRMDDLEAGFAHEGSFYPVTGWMAYAKENYKDDLMAGVRIYCHGKIATQSALFNLKSGFTGEYDIRSYLVGELHAEWLDGDDDLIQTDRRDILWSSEVGQAFEAWGQGVVKRIGKASRDPMKKKAWDVFQETSHISERVHEVFPAEDQALIRDHAMEFAKHVARSMRHDEAADPDQAESVVQLSIAFAPHITLDEQLRAAAEESASPLALMTAILRTARVAELSAFGRIAEDRIGVIGKVEKLRDDPKTLEAALQDLIAQAPWLINPQWAPVTANQRLSTLRQRFATFFKDKYGIVLSLGEFSVPGKRPDFVLISQENAIQMVEIKPPTHAFNNVDMDRLDTYQQTMQEFLNHAGNEQFKEFFPVFRITLVCNDIALTGVSRTAFDGLVAARLLSPMTWDVFLANTRLVHQDFLNEAERQRKAVGVRGPHVEEPNANEPPGPALAAPKVSTPLPSGKKRKARTR